MVTDIADTALDVLSLGAEIRAGLWRKNGQCMNDQVRFVVFRDVLSRVRVVSLCSATFLIVSCRFVSFRVVSCRFVAFRVVFCVVL